MTWRTVLGAVVAPQRNGLRSSDLRWMKVERQLIPVMCICGGDTPIGFGATELTRSCCEAITQLHRYTGAVESFLNYLHTEYAAPASSSSLDRTGTKTDFECRHHVDLAMFTYHT